MFLFQQLRSIRETTSQTPDQASQPNQSTYPTRSSKCMQNVYINEPTQQMHTDTHTQTEIDRAVFAYSSDVNAKNF